MQRFAGRGVVPIAMIDGVPPAGDDEVALGLKTMRALGASLGDTVTVRAPRPPQTRQLRVVGVVILSSQGDAEIEPGEGALVESAAAMTCWPRSSSSWPWEPSSTGSWSCSGAAAGISP